MRTVKLSSARARTERWTMASQTGERIDVHEQLGPSLEERQEPGAKELCEIVKQLLNSVATSAVHAGDLERLKNGVYRLRIEGDPTRTIVLKLLKPAIAQTDRLVMERWLPALGLADRSPKILAGAAQRDGCWVWHAYEDIGDEGLHRRREPARLAAAIALIADLHTRAAKDPLIPEVRWRARDHGVHFFMASLRDAIAAFEALATVRRNVPPEFTAARARLLERLYELRDDAAHRVRVMEEAG